MALHAILEGTGVYHEQAAEALHEAGVSVSVVNPARVRNFAHGLSVLTKTDGVDARVLARFGLLTQPAIWSPPSREARILQALLMRREGRGRRYLRCVPRGGADRQFGWGILKTPSSGRPREMK